MSPLPQYGGLRIIVATNGDAEVVDTYHRFKPLSGEDLTALLLRVQRMVAPPLQVDINFADGRIMWADVRNLLT